MTRRPTVVLAVKAGFTPRFLLRTDILATLLAKGVNVVILTPNAHEPKFREEFAIDGIEFYPLQERACEDYLKGSRLQRWLRILRTQVLSRRGDLTTIDQMAASSEEQMRGQGVAGRMLAQLFAVIVFLARRSGLLRRLILGVESTFWRPFHAEMYAKYRPDVLVVTSLGYAAASVVDPYLMREARHHGCAVVAAILSWDNPSSKGLRGGPVDHVIAWTDTMKRELIDYHDLAPDSITVCGPPHFDSYYRVARLSREELCRAFELDPARRLITFATKSPTNYPWNQDIAEMIARAIGDGRLAGCQLLVRLHPLFFKPRKSGDSLDAALAGMRHMAASFPHVVLDQPAMLGGALAMDMPATEMDKLVGLLRYSAVLVNVYSTMNLEAAITDTPTVNVSFNGYGRVPTSARCDVALDEVQPHNQRIVRSGGVAMVRSDDQLIEAVRQYLEDPHRDAEGRRRIRENECGRYPGAAGAAIGNCIAGIAWGRSDVVVRGGVAAPTSVKR